MDHFRNEYRRLVDSLVKELAAIARDLTREEVGVALAAKAEEEKKQPRVSPRLQRALERAEERRKLAAERRAAALAARATRSRRSSSSEPAASRRGEAAPQVPLAPPPLFVHKRSRDGSIQKLERSAAEAARAESAPPPPA